MKQTGHTPGPWLERMEHAAAPDLLEALINLADSSASVNGYQHAGMPVPDIVWSTLHQDEQKARAAINKARATGQEGD